MRRLASKSHEKLYATLTHGGRFCASPDPKMRRIGAEILDEVINPDREHVEAVAATLIPISQAETEPSALSATIHALGRVGSRDSVLAIAAHATHADPQVRLAMARALPPTYTDGIEPETYLPALLALSADDHDEVRNWACFGLGTQFNDDSPELRAALAARLCDQHENTRAEAIVGLARRGDPRALPALIQAFEDGHAGRLLFQAAAWIGDESLVPYLKGFERDEEVEQALEGCNPRR